MKVTPAMRALTGEGSTVFRKETEREESKNAFFFDLLHNEVTKCRWLLKSQRFSSSAHYFSL